MRLLCLFGFHSYSPVKRECTGTFVENGTKMYEYITTSKCSCCGKKKRDLYYCSVAKFRPSNIDRKFPKIG